MSSLSTEITPVELRDRLLDGYCTAKLPEYFVFDGLKHEFFSQINDACWSEPIEYFIPKTENLGYRKYALINPYSYLGAVNFIVEHDAFRVINDHQNKTSMIKSYTRYPDSTKNSITNWIDFAERDLPALSSGYSHLLIIDFARFYESIYTHSLSWALHTKPVAKAAMNSRSKLFGDNLDKQISGLNNGQTNGLLVGNAISDYMSEIIASEIDFMLEKSLLGEVDYIGLRFRDDFRFLIRSSEAAKKILRSLDSIAQKEFNIGINSQKTRISNKPLVAYLAPWKDDIKKSFEINNLLLQEGSQTIDIRKLEKILREIYLIQRTTNYTLSSLLDKVNNYTIDNSDFNTKRALICITYLLEIAKHKEDATPQAYRVVDTIIRAGKNSKQINELHGVILNFYRRLTPSSYQLIWYHRILISNGLIGGDILLNSKDPIILMLLRDKETLEFEKPSRLSEDNNSVYNDVHKCFKIIDRSMIEDMKKTKTAIKKTEASLGVRSV